jgi:hypothetical protein
MNDLRFVRHIDGLTYEFVREDDADNRHCYRRVDLDIWCRKLPGFGWAVCDSAGTVLSRPFDDAGLGDEPPEGVWVSRKGDRSYVYDLKRLGNTD